MVYVILDPGHAETTPGKRYGEFREYKWNRDMVKVLKPMLEAKGYKVFITCDMDSPVDKPLADRAKFANAVKNNSKPGDHCIFVSVHADAIDNPPKGNKNPSGWAVWTTPGFTNSDKLAECLITNAKIELPKIGLKCRGMSEANFYVIKNAQMPAVLIEHFFYTNPKDVAVAESESGFKVFGDITVDGITEYCTRMGWL